MDFSIALDFFEHISYNETKKGGWKMKNFMQHDFLIRKIYFALYVEIGKGMTVHVNRAENGIAINVSSYEKTYVFSDGKRITIGQNEMIFLPKGTSYQVECKQTGECYAINFEYDGEQSFQPFRFVPKNVSGFISRFEKVSTFWRDKKGAYHMECKALLYEILALMQNESQKEYIRKNTMALIAPAVEYIHENYTSPELKISDLCLLCDVSEPYFRKIFKASYGVSPVKYVNDLKIRYAKELLRAALMPITRIAELSGFGDPAYFSREFKKSVGVAPSEYTAQLT